MISKSIVHLIQTHNAPSQLTGLGFMHEREDNFEGAPLVILDKEFQNLKSVLNNFR